MIPRSDRPSTSADPANKEKTDALIKVERHITIDGLASDLRFGHYNARNIIESLEYSKVCAR